MEPSDEASVSPRISGKSEQNAHRSGFVLTGRDVFGCPSPFYHPYPTRKNITAVIPLFAQSKKSASTPLRLRLGLGRDEHALSFIILAFLFQAPIFYRT
jgi:hypothetical protein